MRRRTTYTAVIATVAILTGYSIGRADSPFPNGKIAPVLFSGYLTSSGAPLSGSHDVSMNLWQASDTSVPGNRVCQGSTQTLDVAAGAFKLQLDQACVDAFSHLTQVWYELVVDGTAFPLEQIGSAPFALRTTAEPSNGTRLVRQRTVTYGSDGYRGDAAFGAITDTQRNETCTATPTFEGGAQRMRCLPSSISGPSADPAAAGLAQDTACTPYPPPSSTLRYYINGYNPYPYVADADASGTVTAIYPATYQLTHATQSFGGTGCGILNQQNVYAYTLGAAVPLSDFVEMQTVAE